MEILVEFLPLILLIIAVGFVAIIGAIFLSVAAVIGGSVWSVMFQHPMAPKDIYQNAVTNMQAASTAMIIVRMAVVVIAIVAIFGLGSCIAKFSELAGGWLLSYTIAGIAFMFLGLSLSGKTNTGHSPLTCFLIILAVNVAFPLGFRLSHHTLPLRIGFVILEFPLNLAILFTQISTIMVSFYGGKTGLSVKGMDSAVFDKLTLPMVVLANSKSFPIALILSLVIFGLRMGYMLVKQRQQ